MASNLPVVAGTLQTDPRSGGLKRSSGVNVLPSVAQAWSEVRDDSNKSVDWIILGYDGNSKTDITVISKGSGGVEGCSQALPSGQAVFGGCRQVESGRFVTFFYADDKTPTMQKGRASMHKNGVLNVLEGSDGEIDIQPPVLSEKKEVSTTDQVEEEVQASPADEPPPVVASSPEDNEANQNEENSGPVTVSYEILKGVVDASKLPKGVDPLNREQSLSDEEFVAVFGMDKDAFSQLPSWKRTKLKKDLGLF